MTHIAASLATCTDRSGHRFVPSVFHTGLEVCERCGAPRRVAPAEAAGSPRPASPGRRRRCG